MNTDGHRYGGRDQGQFQTWRKHQVIATYPKASYLCLSVFICGSISLLTINIQNPGNHR
jgi:hypothetical protein